MQFLHGLTIRQKLSRISMLSSMVALLSASIAFLAYDGYTFRQRLVRRLQTEAQILRANCVSPLLFSDPDAATTTLEGLRAEPVVLEAAVFGEKADTPFAAYARDPVSTPTLLARPTEIGAPYSFSSDHLLISEPIDFEGRRIGTLLIRAELSELRVRQRRYAGIALVILGVSFVLAIGISRIVEKTISTPILHLAETARAVSSGKDYSVRATSIGSRDEIGQLILTFNEMLDQIQVQNTELEQARADLEKRVELRTRELAAANKELETFSYSVSHDLRAPLRAIDGFSNALLRDYTARLDEQGRHYLERVRAGTQRMSQLIDDMLGLARVSRRELVRRKVDVSEIARHVAGELSKQQPARDVRLEIAEGLTVHGDPHLLTIAFENLLGNAWKFTGKKEGGCIEVGKTMNGSEKAFYVRDNGAGFDMAYADKLFGAFQRLHSPADFEGTGIGLATVQRIVSRHGGRIWAEGAVGQGATFYFTLERSDEQQVHTSR
jgi:signal transduction histidine kinase